MITLATIGLVILFARWTAADVRAGDLVKAGLDIAGLIALALVYFGGKLG